MSRRDGKGRRDGGPGLLARGAAVLLVLGGAIPTGAAGQWVEPPGEGWVSVILYHQDTRERFDQAAEERAFFNGGHAVTSALYVTAAVGLAEGVDVWAQVPVLRLQFDDNVRERDRTGIGDVRLYGRVAPLRYLGLGWPVAVRGGVKLPAGDFPREGGAEIIPLGEGQRDWELMLEVGHSFHPRPLFVMAWVGYRWREADEELLRDYGDERFFFAQAGGTLGRLGARLQVEGLDGVAPEIEGVRIPTARRELFQVTPVVSWAVGPGSLEAGVRIPLHGRNLPAGETVLVGYFADVQLF